MRWKKLGQLYDPQPVHPKLATHAANPLAIRLEGDTYRIFFSGRDSNNRSSVGFVDADIVRRKILSVCDRPVFEHGDEESFYSHGVSIGNCYEADGSRYMLFMGWQYPVGQHWRGDIGRLVVEPDYSLRLDGAKPFIETDDIDPVSLSYPWVLRESENAYRMWYGSTLKWDAGNGEMLHVINHANSADGHTWHKAGLGIPYELNVAQAFSRPSVIRRVDGYHMWFSYRSGAGTAYRIGYARSDNGSAWELRLDQSGIDVAASGWDADMIEYPFVFEHEESLYMLYNGNGNGKTGFGIAVLEND